MPRSDPAARLKKLEDQEAAQAAKMQRIKARKNKAARNLDITRKVIAGTMVFERIKAGELSEKHFLADLDRFITNNRHRELFGLPPRTPSTADTEGEEH